MATARDDEITLVGQIEDGGEPALAWAQLTVGERRTQRERGGNLRLRLDDGDAVTVTFGGGRATLLAPRPTPRKGRWDQVADDPRAALVIEAAPGDHVEVEVSGWIVARGARLAVRGAAGAGDGGGRAIAARRIAVVDLDRGVAGDPAAFAALDLADRADPAGEARSAGKDDDTRYQARLAAMASASAPAATRLPRPPAVPVPWRWGAPIFLGLSAGLALAGIATWSDVAAVLHAGETPYPVGLAATGALSLVIALAMWSSRPLYEAQSTAGSNPTFHPTWAIGKAATVAMSVQLVGGATVILIAQGTHSAPWTAASWLTPALTAGALAIWLGVRQRRSLRLARLVLGARALPSPLPAGKWGRFEGTVAAAAGDVPLQRTVAYIQRSQSRTVTERQQDGTMVTKQETTYWIEGRPSGSRLRSFEVAVGTERVVIRDGEASWAAPVEFQPVGKADGRGLAFQTRAAVNGGDSIVVLGRIVKDGDQPIVHGTGPESLLLYAAPAAARRTLARDAFITLAGIATLAAATIACAVVALHLWTITVPT